LVEKAARVTAIEIAATGIDWNFAPCIAVPRDERWGRTYEGFGETPELAGLLGSAAVRGLQNDSLTIPTSIVACAKHYVGDGGTTGGDDQGNTELTETELRSIHLPGYIEAIENGVKTIMASYNSWNGTKLHGNEYLINDVLKTELGFEGFVVSDWAAIDQLPGDYASDVEISINSGIDMVMVPNNYAEFFSTLKSLVEQDKVPIERIDDAVKRILRVKFELGLFESPLADRSLIPLIGSPEHRNVARQCVRESAVLLKKNDNILPLRKSGIKILVAGEHADNLGFQCGGWSIQWQGASGNITEGTTILEGLQKIAPNAEVVYSKFGDMENVNADIAVVVVGEEPYAEGEGDKDDLSLSAAQVQLVRKIKKMGIPVITVLISGRPMIVNSVIHNSDVLLTAWLPGTEGDGIAELLFGEFIPSGVLPMTWQKSMDQIPQNIGDEQYDPLFPYGFGITSYENSELGSPPVLNSAHLDEDGLGIELSFNKSMKNPENTEAEITVTNGSVILDISDYKLSFFDENIITVYLTEPVAQASDLKISYSSGNLSAQDGGILQYFNDQKVLMYDQFNAQLHMIPGRIEAEDYNDMFGIQTESTSDFGGGLNVGWIDDNDWLEYNCQMQSTGSYIVSFRVASLSTGGRINFLADGQNKFSINVPVSGGWQNWKTITEFLDLSEEHTSIRLVAEKGGFNINWFELSVITDSENAMEKSFDFSLMQNYPNPFNPTTKIDYYIAQPGIVNLEVFNVLGEKVATLVNKYLQSGNHSAIWNAQSLNSGVYYYRLRSGNFAESKKLILMK
jgi:beta-glucosidase